VAQELAKYRNAFWIGSGTLCTAVSLAALIGLCLVNFF
jgi:hypothetical protein